MLVVFGFVIKGLDVKSPLNFVITATLLELYKKTNVKWTEDYYQNDVSK